MRKIIFGILAIALTSGVAFADGNKHGGGYDHGRHKRHGYYYHNHHHNNNNNNDNDWVAPLVGGLVIGGILGSTMNNQYYDEPPPLRRACWEDNVYDAYGRWVGTRTICENY